MFCSVLKWDLTMQPSGQQTHREVSLPLPPCAIIKGTGGLTRHPAHQALLFLLRCDTRQTLITYWSHKIFAPQCDRTQDLKSRLWSKFTWVQSLLLCCSEETLVKSWVICVTDLLINCQPCITGYMTVSSAQSSAQRRNSEKGAWIIVFRIQGLGGRFSSSLFEKQKISLNKEFTGVSLPSFSLPYLTAASLSHWCEINPHFKNDASLRFVDNLLNRILL